MNQIPMAEAKAKFNEVAQSPPALITRKGDPAGVLERVSNDDDLESLALAANPAFLRMLEDSARQAREGKAISLDEARRLLDAEEDA